MKYTPETIETILNAISKGLNQKDASVLAGIDETTLSRWKSENADFTNQIRQKEIENKLRNIEIIQEAAKTKWQAAAWFLERKYAQEFSLKIQGENVQEKPLAVSLVQFVGSDAEDELPVNGGGANG